MIKHILPLLLFSLLSFSVVEAQTKKYVHKIQYWFNSPTPVNPVLVVASSYDDDSTTTSFSNLTVDVSSLSAGTHTLYINAKDESENWGTPSVTRFIIGTIQKQYITKGRYWFNSPTPVNPVELNPTYNNDSTDAIFSNSAIDLSSLSPGNHKIYFSTRDQNGRWGTPTVSLFTIGAVQKKYITKGQYWFNSITPISPVEIDPTYSSDSSIVDFSNVQIDVSSLADGVHTLYFRMRDANGRWGTATKNTFTIGGEQKKFISKGQYWFNNVVPTNAVEFTPTYVGDSTSVQGTLANVQVPGSLSNGMHTIYVRYQDNKGRWGTPTTIQFVQNAELAPPTISQMEYFFGNTDPGQGLATAPTPEKVTGIGGRTVSFADSFSIQTLGFSPGVHNFNVRFRSSKNEWGPAISKSFTVAIRPELVSSVADSLRFGNLYSGRDSVTKLFYVKNLGDADLKVKVGTKPSTQWIVKMYAPKDTVAKDSIIIAKDSFATDSALISIMFKPVKSGAVNSFIQFTTNDSIKPVYNLPVAAIADTAIGKLAFTADTIKYGTRPVTTSTIQSVVLSNSGQDTISVTFSNPSTPYTVYHPLKTKLAPNNPSDTIKLSVRFNPTFQGTYNNYVFNITVRNRFNVVIQNKSIYLMGSAIINPNPTINPSATTLNFGAISSRAIDNKDTTITLNIENVGTQSLTIKSITSSDTNVFKVQSTQTPPYNIAFANSVPLDIRFKPTANQFKAFSGNLTITSNSANADSILVILMNGEGTNGPPLSVFALSDSTVDFGSVTIGFSLSKNITISNVGGNRILNVSSLSINNALFTTTQTFPFQVPPDSTRTFALKFTPTSVGNVAGTLNIQTDATSRPARSVELKGNGVITPQPLLEYSLSTIAFGSTKVQTPNSIIFKFKNAGNDTLRADSIYMAKKTSFFTINRTNLKLAPNNTDSVIVTFTPLAVANYTDSLIFISNLNPSRYGIYSTGSGALLAVNIDTNIAPPNPKVIGGNLPQQIGVQLTASLGPNAIAMLFYKLAGATQYDSTQMTTGDFIRFQGTIPANKIGERGAVYYIKISNGIDEVSLPVSFVSVEFPAGVTKATDQPAGTNQTNYRMISVPMSGISGSVDSVLKNFGSYDKNKWRLFRYQVGNYVEHTSSSFQAFAPGRGYWFITSNPQKIRSGYGQVTSASSAYNIDLQNEWNQIGNPFNFAVAWDSVTGKGSNVGALFDYNGTDYVQATTMQPWVGYFVKNTSLNPVTIGIRPAEPGTPGSLPKYSENGTPNITSGEWMLQLKSSAGDVKDEYNFIGMKNDASDEFDINDIEESPKQPGEFLKLRFNNMRWDSKPDYYGYDFRSADENGKVWDFELHTNVKEEKVAISIDQFESVPKNFDIVLIDADAKAAIDLRKTSEFSIQSGKNEITKNLRIVIGTKSFIEKNNFGISTVPLEFAVSQNYPNPFNPSTTIKFALPKSSFVNVTIFDILGKEIKTLVSELKGEGYHFIHWDATNDRNERVASGVYFYRINAQSSDGAKIFNKTSKMLLMK